MTEASTNRKCPRCGVRRPPSDFYPRKRAVYCRYCQQEKMNERTAEKIIYIQKIKLEAGCMDCGLMSPFPEVYDFDHRPGVVKVDKISKMFQGSLPRLVAEIAKCDVVCANCHRIRTVNRKLGRGGIGTFGVDRPRTPVLPIADLDPMLDFGWLD